MELKDYYRREMRRLRETAQVFAADNPTIAGGLGTAVADPDVERLLEGFAFLTAHVHQELDDHYPDLLQHLAQVVSPQYLRPLPAATIIQFSPRPSLKQNLDVRAGAQLEGRASNPDGEMQVARFRTSSKLTVRPLQIQQISRLDPEAESIGTARGGNGLRVQLQSGAGPLSGLELPSLRFCLGGSTGEAVDWLMLLRHRLLHIDLCDSQGQLLERLQPEALRHCGFDAEESLLGSRPPHLPAFELLREYFFFPEKFLYLELDLSAWRNRPDNDRMEIRLMLDTGVMELPSPGPDTLLINTVPAINLFELDAEPVVMDQRDSEYRLIPGGSKSSALAQTAQVHTVNQVEGLQRGSSERRRYVPLGEFSRDGGASPPRYALKVRNNSALERIETFIQPVLPPTEAVSAKELLKIDLTCSNGRAVDAMRRGDIHHNTGDTPELVTFTNLTAPRPPADMTRDSDLTWSLLSDLRLQFATLTDIKSLRAVLRHYLPGGRDDHPATSAGRRRIEGLSKVQVEPDQALFGQSFLRGQRVRIHYHSDHFAGPGDAYLFGCLLDYLVASLATLNTFTVLEMADEQSGAVTTWPKRLGLKTTI